MNSHVFFNDRSWTMLVQQVIFGEPWYSWVVGFRWVFSRFDRILEDSGDHRVTAALLG